MVTPTRLSRAYADAGYLDRNLRAIEVLIDQEAIRSGAAAAANLGSIMTWGMVIVPTTSLTNVLTGWPALGATSMFLKTLPRHNCFKPKPICCA